MSDVFYVVVTVCFCRVDFYLKEVTGSECEEVIEEFSHCSHDICY